METKKPRDEGDAEIYKWSINPFFNRWSLLLDISWALSEHCHGIFTSDLFQIAQVSNRPVETETWALNLL